MFWLLKSRHASTHPQPACLSVRCMLHPGCLAAQPEQVCMHCHTCAYPDDAASPPLCTRPCRARRADVAGGVRQPGNAHPRHGGPHPLASVGGRGARCRPGGGCPASWLLLVLPPWAPLAVCCCWRCTCPNRHFFAAMFYNSTCSLPHASVFLCVPSSALRASLAPLCRLRLAQVSPHCHGRPTQWPRPHTSYPPHPYPAPNLGAGVPGSAVQPASHPSGLSTLWQLQI